MNELEELRLAYAECSRQRNELLTKLKLQVQSKPVMFAYQYDDGTWHDASATEHSAGMKPLYAAPVQQEPVAWHRWYVEDGERGQEFSAYPRPGFKPLFAAPVQAQESTQPASKTYEDGFRSGYKSGWEEGYKNGTWVSKQKPLGPEAPVQAQGEPVQFAEIAIGVLGDRNGFDNWWDDLDKDLQQEILEEIDSAIGEKAAPVQQEPTTAHSAKHSAGSAESFCNDEMEGTGEYVHLCKGVLVTGVRGEVCNRCGKELG